MDRLDTIKDWLVELRRERFAAEEQLRVALVRQDRLNAAYRHAEAMCRIVDDLVREIEVPSDGR